VKIELIDERGEGKRDLFEYEGASRASSSTWPR